MRGKVCSKSLCIPAAGITPAYAGKSIAKVISMHTWRDHPRLCGEKFFQSRISSFLSGSPPPMRGKDWVAFYLGSTAGITPAYAGKSHKNENGDTEFKDHPRLCGEKEQS